MLLISQSERFKEDVKRYQEAIDKIENPQKRNELTKLLSDLVQEVKAIDEFYENLKLGAALPSRVDETRSEVITIRKELDRKLGLKP